MSFDPKAFAPTALFDRITDIRVDNPDLIGERARQRRRREKLTRDGKLTILACDHPARNVTRSGDNPLAMGDRHDYLARILRIITHPDIDGVMATPDIIDDLLIVDYLMTEAGQPSFLDNKVILGCMNRGGLAGAVFELDDRITSYTVDGLIDANLDGAKIMFRLDLENPDSLLAMEYCADAISDCYAEGLPVFLEPLPVEKVQGGYRVRKTAADFIKMLGVASGMGESTSGLWLKIPWVPGFEEVARATTLPILLLGGESAGDPTGFINELTDGMKASNVRGALVGRNVLYPGAEDPLAAALAVSKAVHAGIGAEEALAYMAEIRGTNLDLLKGIAR